MLKGWTPATLLAQCCDKPACSLWWITWRELFEGLLTIIGLSLLLREAPSKKSGCSSGHLWAGVQHEHFFVGTDSACSRSLPRVFHRDPGLHLRHPLAGSSSHSSSYSDVLSTDLEIMTPDQDCWHGFVNNMTPPRLQRNSIRSAPSTICDLPFIRLFKWSAGWV